MIYRFAKDMMHLRALDEIKVCEQTLCWPSLESL